MAAMVAKSIEAGRRPGDASAFFSAALMLEPGERVTAAAASEAEAEAAGEEDRGWEGALLAPEPEVRPRPLPPAATALLPAQLPLPQGKEAPA